MPVITVDLFKGRTRQPKRERVRALTDTAVRMPGGRPQAVAGDLLADQSPD